MASYKSQREKIKNFIERAVSELSIRNANAWEGREEEVFTYNELINFILSDLGVSESMAEDVLNNHFIRTGKLIEVRHLKVPENKELKKEVADTKKEAEEELNKIMDAKPEKNGNRN